MTSNFESSNPIQPQTDSKIDMDSSGRDRFELLSAYLDGEATAAERKQVQQWLDTDSDVQQLHQRLLKLRQGLQTLPVPASEKSAQEISEGVFRQLDRHRFHRAIALGGGALVAVFVGLLPGLLSGNSTPSLRMANTNESPSGATAELPVAGEALTIAVNQPIVEIPKAAVATPEKSVKSGNPNP